VKKLYWVTRGQLPLLVYGDNTDQR